MKIMFAMITRLAMEAKWRCDSEEGETNLGDTTSHGWSRGPHFSTQVISWDWRNETFLIAWLVHSATSHAWDACTAVPLGRWKLHSSGCPSFLAPHPDPATTSTLYFCDPDSVISIFVTMQWECLAGRRREEGGGRRKRRRAELCTV